MDPVVPEWYVTFGVQFSKHEGADKHPLGMVHSGYVVIEAPDQEMGHRIARAIFGDKWSFIYGEEFITNGNAAKWHPDGELLRIAWLPK